LPFYVLFLHLMQLFVLSLVMDTIAMQIKVILGVLVEQHITWVALLALVVVVERMYPALLHALLDVKWVQTLMQQLSVHRG